MVGEQPNIIQPRALFPSFTSGVINVSVRHVCFDRLPTTPNSTPTAKNTMLDVTKALEWNYFDK